MSDRRHGVTRRDYGLPVRYWILPDDQGREGRTVNISPGGLFVRTDFDERQGDTVRLEIELPGQEPMELRGQVVWARRIPTHFRHELNNGFGVELVQAPEAWYRLFLYPS